MANHCGYTVRKYKDFTITHLEDTLTFKVYIGDQLFCCKSTLKAAKREIDRFYEIIKEAEDNV